jgi:CheY-like chemotaxis protein
VLLDADPHRLAQVFSNLLSNASKFSAEGSHVRLSADAADGQVRVRVSDTGIGLDATQLSGVFELFAQVDNSLERARGGLGIGLTLARRLVQLHGGQLEVASAGLGHGSEFSVALPLHAGPPADALPPAAAAPPPAAEGADGATPTRSLRVMVVDDNHDSADMLALSLRLMGHEVRAYYDPLVVVDAARDFHPDLAFMDVGMPVLNGFDLAGRLRAQSWPNPGPPRLVALTGWGQEDDRRRSEQAGFDEHLVKPAELETIERVCREATARIAERMEGK